MTDPQRYQAIYLAVLPAGPRAMPQAAPPLLDAKHFYLPAGEREAPQLSLPQLYVAGVECGNEEARLELKRRVAAFEADFEWFRALRNRVEDDRDALAEQLAMARRDILA